MSFRFCLTGLIVPPEESDKQIGSFEFPDPLIDFLGLLAGVDTKMTSSSVSSMLMISRM